MRKDKAADKRRNAEDQGSRLEIWRVLYGEFEPQVQNRYGGLIGQVLNRKFKGAGVEEFEQWDTLVRDYERDAGEKAAR